jgi:flagellar biosynthesis/type III secretory pathway protein FliH
VPVVIFLRSGAYSRELNLGGERHNYLSFRYLICDLSTIPFEQYKESDNIVARLNLPNMKYADESRIDVYAQAVRGLLSLEPSWEKQSKYIDFIDIYADLDHNELEMYRNQYPEEANKMSSFAERFREEGMQKGMQKGIQQGIQQGKQLGIQQGEVAVLLRLMESKFGHRLTEIDRQLVESADAETLLKWSERILSANSIEEILH